MGFFHSTVFVFVGVPPSLRPPVLAPHCHSLCYRESFPIPDQQAFSYIMECSHKPLLMFLHKHSFNFPLRVGLLNKSEKMPWFSLWAPSLVPRQSAPSWKQGMTLRSSGNRTLDLLWYLFDSALAAVVTEARGSQALAISLMKSFEEYWHWAWTEHWVSQNILKYNGWKIEDVYFKHTNISSKVGVKVSPSMFIFILYLVIIKSFSE